MRFRNVPHQFFRMAQLYFKTPGRRFDALRDHVLEERYIEAPLIFISQLSRSGGTLLSQLFDGHSSCVSFPPELKLGKNKRIVADLNALARKSHKEAMNELLIFNKNCIRKGDNGCYKKGEGNNHPFIFDVFVFRFLFQSLWLNKKPQDGRDVVNIWFSSFFSSWLDYQWPREIKYCTSFASWTMVKEDNVDKFFINSLVTIRMVI